MAVLAGAVAAGSTVCSVIAMMLSRRLEPQHFLEDIGAHELDCCQRNNAPFVFFASLVLPRRNIPRAWLWWSPLVLVLLGLMVLAMLLGAIGGGNICVRVANHTETSNITTGRHEWQLRNQTIVSRVRGEKPVCFLGGFLGRCSHGCPAFSREGGSQAVSE